MSLTKESVEAQAWFGDQRAQVLELVERAERAELAVAHGAAADKSEPGLVDAFVSRDLVQRAFEVLTQDIAASPAPWQRLRRAEALLREALSR